MADGRWLAVDGRWSMGWQLAGGVNLMIPPGTAVRDAHACYEVVVLVTVPDKLRLAPCFLLLPLLPHCRLNRAIHTGAKQERNSTMWNCWRLRYLTIERLFQHSWRGNFSPQFTSTKTSTQSVYFFDAEEKIDEYNGRESH